MSPCLLPWNVFGSCFVAASSGLEHGAVMVPAFGVPYRNSGRTTATTRGDLRGGAEADMRFVPGERRASGGTCASPSTPGLDRGGDSHDQPLRALLTDFAWCCLPRPHVLRNALEGGELCPLWTPRARDLASTASAPNERIGGYDRNYKFSPASEASQR